VTEKDNVAGLPDRSSSAPSSSSLTAPSKTEIVEFLTGSSLRGFLDELDLVGELLKANTTRPGKGASESSENLKRLGESLSFRDRKLAEQAADRFLDEFGIAAEDVLAQLKEELAAANIDIPDLSDSKAYPLAPEQEEGYVKLFVTRSEQLRRSFGEHLGQLVDNPFKLLYALEYLRRQGREPIDMVLGASMLPRLISAFEQFLGGLLRTTLTLHPKALGPYGDVPFELTSRYTDVSDIQRYMVDRKVDTFLKDSPDDWAKYIQKSRGIDLQSPAWDRIREAIQRRHVLIHNGGRADEVYISRLPKNLGTVAEGAKLRCDENYMTEVLVSLRYVAFQLGLQWAWKLAKVPPLRTYPLFVGDIVDSFEKGLWREAQELAEIGLSMDMDNERDLAILKLNRWLCVQQQGHVGDTIAEIQDWKPETKTREVAKAALLRDYDECVKLLKELLNGPRVTQMRRWLKDQPLMERAATEEPKIGRLLGYTVGSSKRSKRKK
jgi:hypothetical protein